MKTDKIKRLILLLAKEVHGSSWNESYFFELKDAEIEELRTLLYEYDKELAEYVFWDKTNKT